MESKKTADETNSKLNKSSHSLLKKLKCSISINRPLIPLKMALFCYYGAGSFMPSFLTLFLRQRGVTLSELSTMITFAPIVQVLGTTLSGVVADKLGRSKPVLVVNMFLVASVVVGMLFMPSINDQRSSPKMSASCSNDHLVLHGSCDVMNGTVLCTRNSRNLSFVVQMSEKLYQNQTGAACTYGFDFTKQSNSPLCGGAHNITCCPVGSGCREVSNKLLLAYAVMYVLFLTMYSNTYRCFDVSVMSLAKEYDSDFGHERFFSILGNMLVSPLAGLVVQVTTPEGQDKNHAAALIFFVSIVLVLFVIIYFLPVVTVTPADKMWNKSFRLLRNIDVWMFLVVILTMGTSFNFTKYFTFWFLDDLNAPSILVGLITSISALYGLPFLLTSKWWVGKLGTHKIFVLSLFSYVTCALGYSFLKNPWVSLVLEVHGAFTYYLLWVAVMEHSHSIAPEGLTSTVIAVSGAIHYSAGKSISGLIGKLVMSEYGGRTAFRFLALVCTCVGVLYVVFRCWRTKCSNTKIDELKETKIEKSNQHIKPHVK